MYQLATSVSVAVLACTAVLGAMASNSAVAQVEVFNDQSAFVGATGATVVPIPDSATAFPSGPICGTSISGTTRADFSATASISIAFDLNGLTITQVNPPMPAAVGLCIFDTGTERNPGNTDPATMIANTIVGNGEDDYLVTFNNPVHAIGFRLLTNNSANEIVELRNATPSLISSENVDGLTAANTRQFVGFKSVIPIKSLLIDTINGDIQNEGIDEIKVAERFQVGIDIKPGSDPNSINLDNVRFIPVAILSSSDLDATTCDPDSISLAGAEVRLIGRGDKFQCGEEDVDGDSMTDLVCHVETADWIVEPGETTVELTATCNGTAIVGEDAIRIVPPAN